MVSPVVLFREGAGDDFTKMAAVSLQLCTSADLIAFSIAIALLGWIRSRLVGWISTISAVMFVVMFALFPKYLMIIFSNPHI